MRNIMIIDFINIMESARKNPLYVKEREFRFNYREANLYPLLVEVFKQFGMKLH